MSKITFQTLGSLLGWWTYYSLFSMGMSLSKIQEIVKDRKAWHVAIHGFARARPDWATEQQNQVLIVIMKRPSFGSQSENLSLSYSF